MITYGRLAALCAMGVLLWGCQGSGVARNEFDQLAHRVATLEDVVAGGGRLGLGSGPAVVPGNGGAQSTATIGKNNETGAAERTLYNQGQSLLKQKSYQRAADTFRGHLQQYPAGGLAPNARYWLGECFYAQGHYQEALAEFLRCIDDYPASGKAPDSLLKAAYCYDRLGDGPRAMASLDLLLRNYPSSESAAMVKSGRHRFQTR